jgi:serine phosphatase RsbU (regulator of sigma subunit)
VSERQLQPGERLVLVTDGVTERHVKDDATFGVQGLRNAIAGADHPTAASTAMAIQRAITEAWIEPLEDDATIVVMAVG